MKLLPVVVFILSVSLASAQQSSCCSPVTEAFASMANDMSFVASHDEPIAFTLPILKGEMIAYPTSDGTTASAYFIPREGSNNFLLVYHEWWGLNDHIKLFAERLSEDLNINVIAPDMYDGKVATTREAARN